MIPIWEVGKGQVVGWLECLKDIFNDRKEVVVVVVVCIILICKIEKGDLYLHR